MAKNKKTETSTDDKVMFDGIPGADKKTAEDAEGFKVDLNFEEEPKTDEEEIEFPKEAEVEEVEELKAEEEPSEEVEEAEETEEPETETEVAEDTGEETVLAEDDSDTQQVEERIPETTDEPKEPMIPKSRFDEVLAKQKALAKKLEEATNPVNTIEGEPEYDFDAKEVEYQEHILNGRTEDAAKLRAEIRTAERQSMMFEVQNRMGKTVQESTEMSALQAKAAELATTFPILDESHAEFDQVKTQEVLDLRDAFMVQGFSGADALDKAAKYIMGPVATPEPKKDVVGEKIVEKKKVANTTKKIEAAESHPPTLKGKNKVEKKIDLDLLSSEEFDALPAETLKRMRGDFG